LLGAGLLVGTAGMALAQNQTPPSGAASPSSPMSAPADQSGRSVAPGAMKPMNAEPSARHNSGTAKDAGSTANTRSND
jgi:hypothetical protein